MRLIDILRLALGNLRRNKLRTFLTVSGVVVGIGAIVFLVSLGYGLQELATKKVANLDALTLLTVNPGNKEDTKLTELAVEKFKKLDGVVSISPVKSFPTQVTLGEDNSDGVLYGVKTESLPLEDIKTRYGSTIKDDNAKEIIVSQAVVKTLKIDNIESIIGKNISTKVIQLDENGNIKDEKGIVFNLKVVGVTSEEKIKYAYVPLNLLKDIDSPYKSIKIKVDKRNRLTETRKTIESMGYPTTSIKDTVDQIDSAFVIIRSVLGGFGMIALFVAAIGIFNTMTISLLERTKEIGIMKAIGGRDKDVARVFTTEASIIGLMGGIFGVFSGWFLGIIMNALANLMAASVQGEQNNFFYLPGYFSVMVIVFAFLVSTFAGVWPAKRAAKLDPLDALRYE
ncbi:MAG: ABC transporter permease [Patescibacteria group bacterium]|nr:ABC transporter permease [Patescibacteria group bacterium]